MESFCITKSGLQSVIRRVRLLLIPGLLAVWSLAAAAATPRILYVGDSWTAYPWQQDPPALRDALDEYGLGQYEENGDLALYRATAADWDTADPLAQITAKLVQYPTIDIIHISLGGNDINMGWRDAADKEAFLDVTAQHIRNIALHCLNVRPNVRVAISSYDYLNISEGFTYNEYGLVTGADMGVTLAYVLYGFSVPVAPCRVAGKANRRSPANSQGALSEAACRPARPDRNRMV